MNPAGRHFLQIPGPTNVPERVLAALSRPTIDHRGPEFARLSLGLQERLKLIFKTSGPVLVFPSSGSGGWESALVNVLSPGDAVLMFETGFFALQWRRVAERLGLEVEFVPGDWRGGVDPDQVEARLAGDGERRIKAVALVHCETSTGALSSVAGVRRAMDRAGHPALLLVDTISSLATTDFRHQDWGVDVTVAASQKGLMLPPGLSLSAVSDKALAASARAGLARSYWDWRPILELKDQGFFPYTPSTNLLFGLGEALDMLLEEGLDNVFARHARLAEATRRAVRAWGLELCCRKPEEYAPGVTAVLMPQGHDSDRFRKICLDRFNLSLGTGLGQLKGRLFRIGHMGYFNELMLVGTLAGVEMGLGLAGAPLARGGLQAAVDHLAGDLGS